MGFIGVQPATVPLTANDITDGIISTAKIADDAVGNTKLDLSANYAFTGTVSGVGGFLPISKSVSTSTVTSVDFDNLSTSFDTFYVTYFVKPATDGQGTRLRFLDSSGTAISSSNAYQYYYDAEGSSINTNGDTSIHISGGVGSANYEGISGYFFVKNRNYVADSTNKMSPSVLGGNTHNNVSGNGVMGFQAGHLSPSSQQAIRGFSIYANAGLESHDVKLYALVTPS